MIFKQLKWYAPLNEFADEIIDDLAERYAAISPMTQKDAFNLIFNNLSSISNLRGANIEQHFEIMALENEEYAQYAAFSISCAYCIQAKNTENMIAAWKLVAIASRWAGVASTLLGVKVARMETIKATRKNTARKGGLAKSAHSSKLKEEVFRLALARRPSKMWPSARQAAATLKDEVVEYAKVHGLTFATASAERKIAEWLRTMPGSASLFKNSTDRKPSS